MSDKSINIDLNDPRAGAIAEVLANKTCKKILDLLAEKEMSESDIANALGAPLNTVGYNIKKLLETGLIIKSKTFFWSVKGKRIPTYRLANKKIVISPRRIPVAPLAFIAILVGAFVLIVLMMQQQEQVISAPSDLKYFTSSDELKKYLAEHQGQGIGYSGRDSVASVASPNAGPAVVMEKSAASAATSAGSYSQTNIQVAGVDEPDFVKNDGKYIYKIVGNKVVIVDAFPAEQMHIVATIDLNQSIQQLFLQKDTLVVIGTTYGYVSDGRASTGDCYIPGRCALSHSLVDVFVYDVKDREHVLVKSNFSLEGNYAGARMIGNHVYLVSTAYVSGENPVLPLYRTNGIERIVPIKHIGYFDWDDERYVFTNIAALSLENGQANVKTYLTGSTGTMYMSESNLYLTAQKHLSQNIYFERVMKEVALPLLPREQRVQIEEIIKKGFDRENVLRMSQILQDYSESLRGEEKARFDVALKNASEAFMQRIAKELEKTKIFKISVDGMNVEYTESGEVPGRVLNQFSMDEFDGKFRIATTTGDVWSGKSLNHLFVLSNEMKIVGSVEDLAPGENIHSVRFMGKRAYVVTFKKIDPFYVIDLSSNKPRVLGYLKIPGYSDYLHPYDENHIIGIGKNARGGTENFAWYQGMKVSLFDVSDFEHPVESAHLDIGDRGTNSPALYDHKAFLFDKEKNLLVLPISLAEIDKKNLQSYETLDNAYGKTVWQGAYVMHIDSTNISVKGKITHVNEKIFQGDRSWVYDYRWNIARTLTMDHVIYTTSYSKIEAHDLANMSFISEVNLPYKNQDEHRYY